MNVPDLDQLNTQDLADPKERQIQMSLLQLLAQYPEAAKYLGPGALDALKRLQTTSNTLDSRRQSIMAGIQKGE